jgi:site-specific recombinase XerD
MELKSNYISADFKAKIWPCFEKEFAARPHTLKNYKNILVSFCEYIAKDFLEVRQDDIAVYYKYLNVKCELGTMSRRSMLTYQKTLRAVAYKTEEYIKKEDLTIFYINVFKDSIASDIRAIRDDMWLISPDEITSLYSCVRNMREMMILLMLSEGGLTAAQIGKLTWECMKTTMNGKWIGYDGIYGFYMSDFMAMAWKDYMQEQITNRQYRPGGLLFTSRLGNPLDTKNISTLVKHCRTKAGLERKITARQLRDYALLIRLDDLLHKGEAEFSKRVLLDDMQKTRMRELYQWMIKEGMIE